MENSLCNGSYNLPCHLGSTAALLSASPSCCRMGLRAPSPHPPPLPKVSYQSGGGNSYSSISSLNDWLSPASSPFSLHSRVVRACTWKCSCGENGQARSHKPTGLFSRSQLGLLLPLRLIVRVCAGPIPLFHFFYIFFFRVKLVLVSLNGVFNQSR